MILIIWMCVKNGKKTVSLKKDCQIQKNDEINPYGLETIAG